MAAEESMEPHTYENTLDVPMSSEQVALSGFAYCLGSCNFTTEPALADKGSTRKEAKLLMSLLAYPAPLDGEQQQAVLTSSESSDLSYASDSSHSQRETFSFTCPSLSLENSKSSFSKRSHTHEQDDVPLRRVSDMDEHPSERINKSTVTAEADAAASQAAAPLPAELLGRPLTVDDRDALRLSADAMARNVLQSFQKAIEWRTQAWIDSLTAVLYKKERELGNNAALLQQSSEAKLICSLQAARDKIRVTFAETSFCVLAQRAPKDDNEQQEPLSKKRCLSKVNPAELEESCEYQYAVTHSLVLNAVVHLKTPAGFSEITLQVPGTMEGSFWSSEPGEELQSAVVELDTHILSAMVEKACRKIVRASVEAVMKPTEVEQPVKKQVQVDEVAVLAAAAAATMTTSLPMMTTPPARQVTADHTITAESVRASIVTPRSLFDGSSNKANTAFSPNHRVLLPICDDFETKTSSIIPRRISPQPQQSANFCETSVPFTPRKQTHVCRGPSLISPAPNSDTTDYLDASQVEQGPSLPMLVEVACRAMRVD